MFAKVHSISFPGRRRQGFTIVEIVIAFIIIGILTLVMVPVLTNRANDARLNAAEQDLEHLANAQDRACTDTGYLYRPYVLNDVADGDGFPNAVIPGTMPTGTQTADAINGIRDNGTNCATYNMYVDPYVIFISQRTGDYLTDMMETNLFCRLTGSLANTPTGDLILSNPNSLNAEKKFNWNGPYINWRRDGNNNDWPDDPWGNDYLYFTQAGVLYPPDPRVGTPTGGGGTGGGGTGGGGTGGATSTPNPDPAQDNSDSFKEASPTYTVGGTAYIFPAFADPGANTIPLFDRPTWVSLGPDGIPGSVSANGTIDPLDAQNYGFGKGDDLIRQ